MNAFVPLTSAPVAPRQQQRSLCPVRPAPFFASAAFGAPVPTRVAAPAKAPVRMDVTIVVGDNEPVESAIRRFKKDVTKSGHLFELRRRRYFETNTEKRIRKAAQARRKAKMSKSQSHRNNASK